MARDITKLHPLLQILSKQLVANCTKAGLKVKVTDCVRTKEEQNGIDASRTGVKYPYSYHNWGLAFDICQNNTKNAYPSESAWWKNVGEIGKNLGLEWGGDWTRPVDRPHFQLDAFGTCEELVKKYGTPEKFFSSTDFSYTTPTTIITPTSVQKKIFWLQTRLNCAGYPVTIDGVYGKNTIETVKKYWKEKTGKTCTGKKVSIECIKMLAS